MSPEELQKLPAALFEIGKLIGSDLDPGILLSRIAELICQLIDAKSCSVMLLDADRKRLDQHGAGDHQAGRPQRPQHPDLADALEHRHVERVEDQERADEQRDPREEVEDDVQ